MCLLEEKKRPTKVGNNASVCKTLQEGLRIHIFIKLPCIRSYTCFSGEYFDGRSDVPTKCLVGSRKECVGSLNIQFSLDIFPGKTI